MPDFQDDELAQIESVEKVREISLLTLAPRSSK